jgi:hypothetical protein
MFLVLAAVARCVVGLQEDMHGTWDSIKFWFPWLADSPQNLTDTTLNK